MSLATVASRALAGIDAPEVTVEVHLGPGLPSFTIVGLPDAEVREAKDRVRAALNHTQFEFPARRITVNLAPADLPKDSGRFDLPIALGILAASGQIAPRGARRARVRGRALAHRRAAPGARRARDGAAGAGGGARLRAAGSRTRRRPRSPRARSVLPAAHACWRSSRTCAARRHCRATQAPRARRRARTRISRDVKGQPQAKRALEVAAAGGHSVLMIGPPGTGKSMLAARFPGILPPMSEAEALEVRGDPLRVGGGLRRGALGRAPLPRAAPQRVGRGDGRRRPACRGRARSRSRTTACCSWTSCRNSTATCWSRCASRSNRARVSISRAARQSQFPARFQLVAAMNPCPCGHCGSPAGRCRCTPERIARYRGRISGPAGRPRRHQARSARAARRGPDGARRDGESSEAIRGRVLAAHRRQLERQGKPNALLGTREIDRHCAHRRGRRPAAAPRARAPDALGARLPPRAARGAHHRRSRGRCRDRAPRTSPRRSSTEGSTRAVDSPRRIA